MLYYLLKLKPPSLFSLVEALLFSMPVVLAAALMAFIIVPYNEERRERVVELAELDSAKAMRQFFDQRKITWPPDAAVIPLTVKAFPPGLSALAVKTKKRLFFKALLPAVLAENAKIRRQRQRLRSIFALGWLAPDGRRYREVMDLGIYYRVPGDPNDPVFRHRLLLRVDTLPPALALAQAANESAWGTSRFAREGNNLFGHWTWDPAEGMLPRQRDAGATHFVRIFPDIQSAVGAYLHNINSGAAYRKLRRMRAAMRAAGQAPDPLRLAGGLVNYSERGEAYVRAIRTLIRSNGLDALDPGLSLMAVPPRR
jgi:Bax protein